MKAYHSLSKRERNNNEAFELTELIIGPVIEILGRLRSTPHETLTLRWLYIFLFYSLEITLFAIEAQREERGTIGSVKI